MLLVKKVENSSEFLQAIQIRTEVFVVEQGVPASEEYDSYDSEATHYLAIHGREPSGTARWRMSEDGVKLERFAVLSSKRRKGIGSALLQAILGDVKQHRLASTMPIYLHSQTHAVPFYEQLGFKAVGKPFDECDIEHYKMILETESPSEVVAG